MCLIMSAVSAAVFFVLYSEKKSDGKDARATLTAALMFLGSTLMWVCDSVASVIGGEPFFTIDSEDTILGIIIVSLGLAAYVFFYVLFKALKAKRVVKA